MKYKDILDTFGGDTSYADRAQAALLKGDTAAFSNVAKEYKTSQQTVPQPSPNPANSQGDNVGNWNYGADTADRQDEIVSNLNAAYEQNPSQFSDWNTFAQNYNYDYSGRTDKERETMWNWYNNKVGPAQPQQEQPQQEQTLPQVDYNNANNTDYFFNQLLNGNPLQGEGAAITAAQNRYNNLKYLSSMTPDQLSSAIASGNLNPVGQDMQDLKNYSPALYAQVQAQIQKNTQLDDINTLGNGIYNGLTKTETNGNYTNYDMSPTEYTKNASIIKQYNESLYNKIAGLGGDTAAYVAIVASMLQNPMIQSSKNEVEELEGEIRKIQENIYTIGDTSRSVLGSEAPEDLVSAYISHQTKQLQNQLRTTQNSLLVAQGKLNNQLTEVETMIDAIDNGIKLQQYNDKMAMDGLNTGTGGGSSSRYSYSSNYSYAPTTQQPQDTYNYQDDSDARLKQIANNLEKLHNSNPELFNNRGTFNDYFKYNQRSAKQKQVLDSYWAKYGNKFSIGGTNGDQGGETTYSNDKRQRLKQGIINGDVGGSYEKAAVRKYGFDSGLNEEEVAVAMAQICSPSEYQSIYKRLGETARTKFKGEVKGIIQDKIKNNMDKIKTRMKSAGKKEKESEAEKLAKELGINYGGLGKDAIMSYYNSL